jgi:hypothetical protein
MVYVSPSTPYMALLRSFLAKKHRLAVDQWGADSSSVKHIYTPLIDHILEEVPPENREIYPHPAWRLPDRVGLLARNILVSEFLVKEWAAHFVGMGMDELDRIAKSFMFAACEKREGLNGILMENAKVVG